MWEESDDYHHHNLGRAFAEAKTRMIEDYWQPYDPNEPRWATTWTEYHAIIWNLAGDPLVPLFSRFPGTLDVAIAPKRPKVGKTFELKIKVKDGGEPVEGVLVTVMKSDENVYLTGYTDAKGSYNFELPPLESSGNLNVTATKHNYTPHEHVLAVSERPNGGGQRAHAD
jgi:hypothetical protein